jgi:uncharacterized protein YjbJ (UPF0337 family)
MNRNILQGRLKQQRGRARQEWGLFNYDNLEEFAGSYDRLTGRVQEAWGWTWYGIVLVLRRIFSTLRHRSGTQFVEHKTRPTG